jgi:hypothetical protein
VLSNSAISTGKQPLEKKLFVGQYGSEMYALPTLFDPKIDGYPATGEVGKIFVAPEASIIKTVVPAGLPAPDTEVQSATENSTDQDTKITAVTVAQV